MTDTPPTPPAPVDDSANVDARIKRLVKEAMGEFQTELESKRTAADEPKKKTFLGELFS